MKINDNDIKSLEVIRESMKGVEKNMVALVTNCSKPWFQRNTDKLKEIYGGIQMTYVNFPDKSLDNDIETRYSRVRNESYDRLIEFFKDLDYPSVLPVISRYNSTEEKKKKAMEILQVIMKIFSMAIDLAGVIVHFIPT